jgi:RHS repeat-associated protein
LTTEAFGNAVAQWGSSANPYRFAGAWGYRDDGDTGLLHVGARYYDPQVGRFISRDAVLSEHAYPYCEHEPVNNVDPSGRIAQWIKGIGAALAIGGGFVAGIGGAVGAAPVVIIGGSVVGAVGGIIWAWDELAALEHKIGEWISDIGDWLQDELQRNPPTRLTEYYAALMPAQEEG